MINRLRNLNPLAIIAICVTSWAIGAPATAIAMCQLDVGCKHSFTLTALTTWPLLILGAALMLTPIALMILDQLKQATR